MKIEINNWTISFFQFQGTYSGLLVGEPNVNINDSIINRAIDNMSKKNIEVEDINLIKEYSGYFGGTNDYDKCEHALKSVCISFMLYDYEIEKSCAIIGFADESESPEEAISRIISNYKIKTFNWSF